MLSISTKSKYGLKAVLALAGGHGQGVMQLKDIAAAQAIPRQYLEQIFNQLGKANIIRSVRGKHGGYTLARPPGEITAAEIIGLLEGGIDFTGAADPDDIVYDLLRTAEEKLQEVLNVSLAELIAGQQQRRRAIFFDI